MDTHQITEQGKFFRRVVIFGIGIHGDDLFDKIRIKHIQANKVVNRMLYVTDVMITAVVVVVGPSEEWEALEVALEVFMASFN